MRIDKINLYRTNRFLNTANKDKSLNNCKQNINSHSDLLISNNIPFMRKWEEHKSWGANCSKDGTSFKVLVHSGAEAVDVEVKRGDKYVSYPLEKKGKGIFETKEPIKGVMDGDRYHYVLRYPDGYTERDLKDPYSFKQPDIHGDSEVYDQSKYKWHDSDWFDKSNKNRVSRLADDQNQLTPVGDLKIYEINCASLTQKGDFEAAKSAIKKAYYAGFNAIEIMPVENTYSFNWGYDGVDKFAVSEYLGGPDQLKSLIDYCHQIGINVIMDVVPNHIGPDGERLMNTGPYLKGKNDFGQAFNFENNESEYVRDYIVNASLNWIDNYHCDGLRLDMTKFMDSDITMKQIAIEVNYHKPDVFLIAEDARKHTKTTGESFWTNNNVIHDERIVFPLESKNIGTNDEEHEAIIKGIADMTPNALSEATQKFIAKLGYDSEWDFPFYHGLHDYLFGGKNLGELADIVYASENRVKYVMSHDEIGNHEGTRLIQKLVCERLKLNQYIVFDDNDWKRTNDYYNLKNQNGKKEKTSTEAKEDVENQKAQLMAGKLVTMLATGDLKSDENIYALGINRDSNITVADVQKAYDAAFAKQKNALAFTYAIPGPKMVFQGDENSDLTPFRFFRKFSDKLSEDDEKNLFIEKGYKAGESALIESKLGGIKYSDEYRELMRKSIRLTKFLNKFNNRNGQIIKENTITHAAPKVLGLNITNDEGEFFIVSNFSDTDYPNPEAGQYYIDFPKGEWREILNTDDTKYGGKGEHHNTENLVSESDFYKLPINLPANSTLYFQKVEAPKDSADIEQS